ncbi:MAG TPA: AfsA-related hotdog domain-containing protein [Leptospiraceae bacterium]|nr:AfsA-related hotdog domain-containing protein [Leptospiraceae bacterium]HMW05022.1 AfsA-related hotdog domain-containing protein [Leptospiraceae bacterium]HMX31466.1 AfsA-related hotdog domain-containing protein [Leptospiraceae bacterium]HMY33576.1 AfsA-related hotdog domain-containing protein [Leptospiraceae bacterium]HMZ62575.1 AfsA-related hotdog domain-containing protein [Leptospiraceae bacterium]
MIHEFEKLEKFDIPNVIVLDKQYTRTYFQEDSLISNIRRALQREISVDLFEKIIHSQISEEEDQFLLNYYEKRKDKDGIEAYLLRTIPQRITRERASQYTEEGSITEEEKEYLFKFYTLDEGQQRYILQNNLTEADEIKILKMFNMRSLHINNVQKAMISEILEKVEELPKKEVFFANLYTPPDHKFFSPPNLKHISGMQITEAARQFAIACCHKFGKVPFEDVTFLLQSLTSEFFQYAKVNMPIKMRAIAKDLKLNKDKSWSYVDIEISIYQENVEISKVKTVATILPLKVYKRLKTGQEEVYEIDPRFRLSEKFKNNISVRYLDGDKTKKWVCHIENFSKKGFMVHSEGADPPRQMANNDHLEFFMHFDLAGFVHGRCKMIWMKSDTEQEDNYYSGFEILDMTSIDQENLNEAISRYGRLIEEREIF